MPAAGSIMLWCLYVSPFLDFTLFKHTNYILFMLTSQATCTQPGA